MNKGWVADYAPFTPDLPLSVPTASALVSQVASCIGVS